MYAPAQLFCSLGIICAVAILFFCFNRYCMNFLLRNFFSEKTSVYMFYAYSAILFALFMVAYNDIPHRKILLPSLSLVVLFALYKNQENAIVFFCAIIIATSSSVLGFNFINEYININTNTAHGDAPISFKSKPNIYLFWLESYHDFDTMKKLYNYDNSKFENFLLSNQFTIKNNVYSSAYYTLASFAQLYTCTGEFTHTRGELDAEQRVRDIIGGSSDNFVFKVLKSNGYRTTQLAMDSYYYFTKKGEYLDDTDLEFGMSWFMYPITSVNYLCSGLKRLSSTSTIYHGSLLNRVETAMARSASAHTPYFITFKGGANHVRRSYNWKDRQELIASNRYQRLVARSEGMTKNIIDYIIKHDPNALIVLLGDHGAWSFHEFPLENSKSFEQYNVDPMDIADDMFRVLLAYRLPGGVTDDISYGEYMNNSNIFLHIFAYLSGDTRILENRKPVTSKLGVIEIIDGKLQPLP